MDQQDLPGQCSANNALQYDENIANYDYSTKMIPNYDVNETMMTEAMSNTQSNVSDPYNYNFMQTDNFYSNSVPQPHIPTKSDLDNNASSFCMDLPNAVHSANNSYTNTSDPQLCIDITAGSNDLDLQSQQSHYGLSNDMDFKENLFHEKKDIDNNFADGQLSSNAVSHRMSSSYANEFSNIQHPSEIYCNQTSQESMILNDMPTNQNLFNPNSHNIDSISNQPVIEPSTDIHGEYQGTVTSETLTVKDELKQSEMVPESLTVPFMGNIQQAAHMEGVKEENVKIEVKNDPETKSTVNGVDEISIKDEIADIQMCIRNGCVNRAVNNPEWEQEFCSNDCVIIHCRNVFTAWVKANEINSQ